MKFLRILAFLAIVAHLVIVGSLLRQPLGVHQQAGLPRFLGWRLYHDSVRMWGPGADFFAVYHAGVNASVGTSIYRPAEVRGVTPYFYAYRYLPVLAHTLGRVVILMPPATAYYAWVVALDVVFWCLICVVFRRLADDAAGFVAWMALVLSTPFFLELHMGQFTFIAVALLALGTWMVDRPASAASRSAWRAIGVVMTVMAIGIKLFPAASLLSWLRRPSLWVSLAAVVGLVGLMTVPGFLLNLDSWYAFQDENAIPTPNPGNVGLMAAVFLTLGRLGVDWTVTAWSHAILIATAVFVGVAAIVVLLAKRQSLYGESAVLLLALFQASYQVWEHHFSGALVAGALLMVAIQQQQHGRNSENVDPAEARFDRTVAWLCAGLLVFVALPTPYALYDPNPKFWTFSQRMLVQWAKPLPVLGLYGIGLAWLGRQGFQRPQMRPRDRAVRPWTCRP